MKIFRLISMVMPMFFALAACNNNELLPKDTSLDNENEIRITATMGNFTAEDGAPEARATIGEDGTGSFENGDEIGVWSYFRTAQGESGLTSATVTYNSSGLLSGFTTTWEDYEEKWAENPGAPLIFTAIYPGSDAAFFSVQNDQNTADSYEKSDLLAATLQLDSKPQNGVVNLDFEHKMACLKITLLGEKATDASVTVKNIATQYIFNIDGSIILIPGQTNPGDITPKAGEITGTFYAVVPPQILADGLKLSITANGKTTEHTVKDTQGKVLESNRQYPIELTLSEGGATGGVTTAEALLAAMKTGGTPDNPTKITLGGDITMPKGPDAWWIGTPMTGGGYYKIDGGGHTLSWVIESGYYLGNDQADADATYIEITNTKLVYEGSNLATVCIYNGKITLGEGVTAVGHDNMILASGGKATLELGNGCVLPSSSKPLASVIYGATLVLNGGATAAGAYIRLQNAGPNLPAPVVSIPKALTKDVSLILYFYMGASETLIAEGTSGYQLTEADFNHLIPHPTESAITSNGKDWLEFGGNCELYLDSDNNQIKLRKKA